MNFLITKNGKKARRSLYAWNEGTRTLSTNEDDLVLDFTGINGVTFNTGDNCTFETGFGCAFNTGHNCTFRTNRRCTFGTGYGCVFNTDNSCVFNTGKNCIFNTSGGCVFYTGFNCTFNTGPNCTFKTNKRCTFKTGDNCTFDTSYNCTFETGRNCIIIRRDVFEVIEIPKNVEIILNGHEISGYIVQQKRKIVKIDGKEYYKDEVRERLRELRPVIY